MKVYRLVALKESVLLRSTSGGAFTVLAETVLSLGGSVYGAAFNERKEVCHQRITSESSLYMLVGTKYVQSKIGDSYIQTIRDLRAGCDVMFVGTPCQIDGLKHYLEYLNCDTSRLVLVDLICHCVPSPKVWRDFVSSRKIEDTEIVFRDKKHWTWLDCKGSAYDGEQHYPLDDFTQLFYSHEICRPSCYKCRYANLNRPGDITLGDAWLIDDNQNREKPLGESLVLVNTKKGESVLRLCKDCKMIPASLSSFRQPQLYNPIRRPLGRSLFWRRYKKGGIELVVRDCEDNHSFYSIRKTMISRLKSLFR